VEKALLAMLPRSDTWEHLDIGTGTGRILEVVGERVSRAVGIDLSREMLAVARANLERVGAANCQVRQGDMNRLPLPAESFDVATLHLALHYAEDPGVAIAEAARVLRPGGRLIVIDFAPHHEEHLMTEHAHRWLGFTDEEIARWYNAAGLQPGDPVHLSGKPLTVCLWPAERPVDVVRVASG
jgi:ArsR family transcriptional regulator